LVLPLLSFEHEVYGHHFIHYEVSFFVLFICP
jgi:hypothetical protein